MKDKCDALRLGKAGAIVSAVMMALLWIGWQVGIYANAAQQMANWHLFFSQSIGGLIAGVIEGAVHGFIWLYLLAWIYNKL
ncbi:hypothetical protein D6774_00505 [Candidatus Woesearchaeota archaeon]|nr:MAG: hypothetical protein D6774_00505 [Candidatus Woesearchaeota archaeon]